MLIMKTYIVETIKFGHNKRMITKYTPSEYMFTNIILFFLNLFIFWPIELAFQIVLFIIKLPIILFLGVTAIVRAAFSRNKILGIIVGIIGYGLIIFAIFAILSSSSPSKKNKTAISSVERSVEGSIESYEVP